jgi:hypothetical protein
MFHSRRYCGQRAEALRKSGSCARRNRSSGWMGANPLALYLSSRSRVGSEGCAGLKGRILVLVSGTICPQTSASTKRIRGSSGLIACLEKGSSGAKQWSTEGERKLHRTLRAYSTNNVRAVNSEPKQAGPVSNGRVYFWIESMIGSPATRLLASED